MAKKRINANFYTISYYKPERIKPEELAEMPEEIRHHRFWWVKYELPDGRLYSGWGCQHPTKITKDDLPEDYILMSDYKKHGYIRTKGVVDLIYDPSPFHNHAFKDDFLYISYTKKMNDEEDHDEYIWGNDIVDFIFAVERWSPEVNVSGIKQRMVEQHNLYCDEMSEWPMVDCKKIERLEELL